MCLLKRSESNACLISHEISFGMALLCQKEIIQIHKFFTMKKVSQNAREASQKYPRTAAVKKKIQTTPDPPHRSRELYRWNGLGYTLICFQRITLVFFIGMGKISAQSLQSQLKLKVLDKLMLILQLKNK